MHDQTSVFSLSINLAIVIMTSDLVNKMSRNSEPVLSKVTTETDNFTVVPLAFLRIFKSLVDFTI